MPKQDFEFADFAAPLVVGPLFAVTLLVLCIIINFTCITRKDDFTKFEKLGARYNIRLGPHPLKMIRRGGWGHEHHHHHHDDI